jgi:hypothetical protein
VPASSWRVFGSGSKLSALDFTITRTTTSMPTKSRSYQDAIHWIDSLQSNAASIEAFKKDGKRLTQQSMPEVIEYLSRIGYTVRFAAHARTHILCVH